MTRYSWDTSLLNLASQTLYPNGSPSAGLTTNWTWIPLVGVSSVTHPSGKVERYSYDSCGRLSGTANTANAATGQYSYYISADEGDHSWIRSRAFRTASQYADDIVYYNGLGLPEQKNQSGMGRRYDVCTPYTYDALLRPDKEWLPMFVEESYTGVYYGNLINREQGWYEDYLGSCRTFTETYSEFSPSGRQLSTALPGENYDLHPSTFEYLADVIDGRNVTGVKTTDGDGRVSIEWTDYEGRAVAHDRFLGSTLARTLYRYDWRGNLTEVITPEGNTYSYEYDSRSRLISKTIPGREAEVFSYDSLDRVISSQDGNQRANGVTILYSYDDIGDLLSKSAVRSGVTRPLTEYTYSPSSGLKISELVYRLTSDGWVSTDDYLTRSFTYDSEERVSRVIESDSSGEYTLTTAFTYDTAGDVLTCREECRQEGEGEIVILTTRSYDSRSRLTGETISVNGVQKSSVTISYDEFGRPSHKHYGTGNTAISESADYTIQGWTKIRNSSLLWNYYSYENSAHPSWTGNITQWSWRHTAAAGELDASGMPAVYQSVNEDLTYDSLNRLSGSAVEQGSNTADNRWSERNISYDLDGNLLHLERYQSDALVPQTVLNFSYTGPRRNGYSYDSNGNIIYDPLRCFEIRYNLLNSMRGIGGHPPR